MTDGRDSVARPKELVIPRLGAEVVDGGTLFTVFTTRAQSCRVTILAGNGAAPGTYTLQARGGGVFSAMVAGVGHGALYEIWLGDRRLPDPYARFLPDGVHGPAMVVAPGYEWRHGEGVATPAGERVIYELHIGTFTAEGTYASAMERLPHLVELGVTMVELLPVSSFAGRRGWGYDGVAHFAPHAPYGTPDDLRRLVDAAHGLGLGVILDVVYNHFGPAGNYLTAFSPDYFISDIQNAWGDSPDFGHPAMRRYVLDNARTWLSDFRFDGLRLDATHAIIDRSPTHILAELSALAHRLSPRKLLIAEDDRNDPGLVRDLGLDAQWADDFHHAVHVTATGERDGYYGSYEPGAATIAAAIQAGWIYQGQVYPATDKPRGRPTQGMPAEAFVYCLQNHDQVGNRALGDRLAATVGVEPACAMATVLLFLPMTPMLFMGEEWAATSPFQFFTDHEPELGQLICQGRRREFRKFRAFSDPAAGGRIPDPQAEETFQRSKLRWEERAEGDHARVLALYTALLRLRRQDRVLRVPSRERCDAQAEGNLLVCRRWSGEGERLLLANVGPTPIAREAFEEHLKSRIVLLRSDGAEGPVTGSLAPWFALIASNLPGDGGARGTATGT